MRKLFYMPIEKVESRYTHQLTDWNVQEFKRLNVKYSVVEGTDLPAVKGKIVTGSVLDAHGRTYYSMTQMANLVALMKAGKVMSEDVIFFEDMFTPGIESLAYIMDQVDTKYRPRIFVRCLAQTIDPDDFVNRTGMFKWMRQFEKMLDSFVSGILVASEEMVSHLRIAGFQAPIFVTGLPFGKAEVQSRVPQAIRDLPVAEREPIVSFAARWDTEKQPSFFLKLIDRVHSDPRGKDIKFQILTGNKKLKSNDPSMVDLARAYQRKKKLMIREGLTKNEYYHHLAKSKVLFNCALQDWVSNTVSEADALGCYTLFPAYRSFPEVFANDAQHMYIPWSIEDASEKLIKIVTNEIHQNVGAVSEYQNGTIERTIRVFNKYSMYSQLGRNSLDYRKYVAQEKY